MSSVTSRAHFFDITKSFLQKKSFIPLDNSKKEEYTIYCKLIYNILINN